MSEIKGQILGVVLVLAIFGTIAGVLLGAFTKNAEAVAGKITENSDPDKIEPVNPTTNNLEEPTLELLSF